MGCVALLSNPVSTGNRGQLPRIRSFCAGRSDIFHYEVEAIDQISDAMRAIARVKPQVLVVNGGDGTVQAVLTELYNGRHFGAAPPPIAVLPNGKTNLIALDLGASGDPLAALSRIVDLAKGDLAPHLVQRELIALSEGEGAERPVMGMFLGGAGLADVILYCRHRIYPLGLPNTLSHVLAAAAALFTFIFGFHARFLPPSPSPVTVSLIRDGRYSQRLALLIVTTLEKLLLGTRPSGSGGLKLMAIDQTPGALLRALAVSLFGGFGRRKVDGVHFGQGDMIRIEGERASVILDGEEFHATAGRPIVLRSTAPIPFIRLAA